MIIDHLDVSRPASCAEHAAVDTREPALPNAKNEHSLITDREDLVRCRRIVSELDRGYRRDRIVQLQVRQSVSVTDLRATAGGRNEPDDLAPCRALENRLDLIQQG